MYTNMSLRVPVSPQAMLQGWEDPSLLVHAEVAVLVLLETELLACSSITYVCVLRFGTFRNVSSEK